MEFKKGITKRFNNEIQLSDKQRDILNRLKVSCQARKIFNEWNSLLSEIEKHNEDLNYLHSEFDNFSFDNIIKNPVSITADIIEIYGKNISIPNQYKHKSKRLVFYFETSLFLFNTYYPTHLIISNTISTTPRTNKTPNPIIEA